MWKQNWTPCSCNEFLSQYQRAFSASEDLCNLLLAFTSMLGFIPPLQQRGQSNHIPVWITHVSYLVFLLSHFCPCHKHRANIPFDIWSKYSHSSTSDQSSSTRWVWWTSNPATAIHWIWRKSFEPKGVAGKRTRNSVERLFQCCKAWGHFSGVLSIKLRPSESCLHQILSLSMTLNWHTDFPAHTHRNCRHLHSPHPDCSPPLLPHTALQ